MMYIDPNGNFPRYYGDIMNENDGWQLGDALPSGWQEVADAMPPEPIENKIIVDGEPEVIDGILTRTYVYRDFTEAEINAKNAILSLRDKIDSGALSDAEIMAIKLGLV